MVICEEMQADPSQVEFNLTEECKERVWHSINMKQANKRTDRRTDIQTNRRNEMANEIRTENTPSREGLRVLQQPSLNGGGSIRRVQGRLPMAMKGCWWEVVKSVTAVP